MSTGEDADETGVIGADVSLLQLFTRHTGALLRWERERGIFRPRKDPKHGRFNLPRRHDISHCRHHS